MSNDNSNSPRERFEQHQQAVANQERANQIKTQDLIRRERKLEDDKRLIAQERKMLEDTQALLTARRQRRSTIVLPMLLVTAIAAGVFAFQNMEQQQRYFEQVSQASKSIDKLAQVLSMTQDEVTLTSGKLSNKQLELERTKGMLAELRATTNQLQFEISQIRGDEPTSVEDTTALTVSADNLSGQLAKLRAQLEENYLTNDINEVYIEYQESDLRQAQKALQEKESELAAQKNQLQENEQRISELQQALLNASASATTP